MDKDAIFDYIESNYDELVEEYIKKHEMEFYKFCEDNAMGFYAGRDEMAYDNWKEDPDRREDY